MDPDWILPRDRTWGRDDDEDCINENGKIVEARIIAAINNKIPETILKSVMFFKLTELEPILGMDY